MIRVIRVRYKCGKWFSHPVDAEFNTVELAREYYKNYFSVEKIFLDYELISRIICVEGIPYTGTIGSTYTRQMSQDSYNKLVNYLNISEL